jgi:hypothetical protein
VWAWSTGRGLKPKFYKLARSWSLWGSSPERENSHGRTGNRTRDLMVSSQKLWTPNHEADHSTWSKNNLYTNQRNAQDIHSYLFSLCLRCFGVILSPSSKGTAYKSAVGCCLLTGQDSAELLCRAVHLYPGLLADTVLRRQHTTAGLYTVPLEDRLNISMKHVR